LVRTALVLLTGLLGFQLFFHGVQRIGHIRYETLSVDEPLPFSVEGWQPNPDRSDGQLHAAFLCTPNCAACAALADRFASALPDTLPGGKMPIWLLTADSVSATRWADDHALSRSDVYALGIRPKWGGLTRVYGSLYFTPIRVMLTDGLIVYDARPSDQLPSAEERNAYWSGGGIAPESLQEFIEIVSDGDKSAPSA
jgi:hypothetical protein